MSNTTAIGAIGALAGAVVGLVGVLIAQYLTQRRHDQALHQTAELEEQRANKDALLKYLEVVGQLLTDPSRDESLLTPIIRAQTLTLLEALAPDHKRILLQFLYELNLIVPEKPGLSFQGANLGMETANLERANLAEAYLERAHLERANLAEAYLERANLAGANLLDADLREANLAGANLKRANLAGANLKEADLRKANLEEANLVATNLRRADLAGANLKEADLSGAFLREIAEESLTQTQINEAVGNDTTKLPDHLQRPAHWMS